ncbi:MAG: pyruvate/ketoisovalerate oxidoreductase, gamma subunit [Clostridia bacterium]|jgi:pyruvate ferredoxin oxidoreductase gamma subunit|nr:pyruvate/ketoisovalerate oxidoreductase, gamma subunit [Clostridia bacterium]
MMLEITFLGRGGQGAFTSSRILGAAASLHEKKHSLSFPSFGPERRGAPVFAYTKISDEPIRDRSQSSKSDYIVILDESLYTDALLLKLKEGGKVIINSAQDAKYEDDKIITFEASHVATEFLGAPITNTAMLAVLVCYTNIVSIESLISAINEDLSHRVAVKNQKLVQYIAAKIGGEAHV